MSEVKCEPGEGFYRLGVHAERDPSPAFDARISGTLSRKRRGCIEQAKS
jgi:hypothetical protein